MSQLPEKSFPTDDYFPEQNLCLHGSDQRPAASTPGGVLACTDSGKVRITITDTGNGIPKEHWNEIFKPFYRIDKARSRAMGGVGLGLALVNDIAELHYGCVFVQDSTPEGTRICIDLPIK